MFARNLLGKMNKPTSYLYVLTAHCQSAALQLLFKVLNDLLPSLFECCAICQYCPFVLIIMPPRGPLVFNVNNV